MERLYNAIKENNKILFVFIARDSDFSDTYLIEQQKKLSQKFPNKVIDLLYIIHSEKMSPMELEETQLTDNIVRVDCNVCYATNPNYPESWNGNTKLYYAYLMNNYTSLASIGWVKSAITDVYDNMKEMRIDFKNMQKQMDEILFILNKQVQS